MIFNTELVLEAAKKVDENVGCYQKGNLIGIAFAGASTADFAEQ